MTTQKIRDLISQLHEEIQTADIDAETRALLAQLDSEIDDLIDSSSETTDASSALERAKMLETRFASNHPTAERFLREILETLAEIGV